MKLVSAICFALFIPGCATARHPPAPATGEAAVQAVTLMLPVDAQRVVEKLAACNHFAGEFSGDRSTRDREVSAAITQLRCETIEEDVRLILLKYPGNGALVAALKVAADF